MMVTDASIWVSLLHRKDVYRTPTHAWPTDYLVAGNELIAPNLLLAEVCGAIARRTGRSHFGHLAAAELLGSDFLHLIPIDQQLAQLAAEMAADYRLRGADALYTALA